MNLKRKAALSALEYISNDMQIVGVGSGSTVNEFIHVLSTVKHRIEGCVSSSQASTSLLRSYAIPVFDLNVIDYLPLYIDGADEVNRNKEMIKGGGGALTREKILAVNSREFVCIVDESKMVAELGVFPIAVEVLPIARSYAARKIVELGGDPVYRQGFVTDNGNIILDVFNLDSSRFKLLEDKINCIPGVVENGIFMQRVADTVLVARSSGEVVILE